MNVVTKAAIKRGLQELGLDKGDIVVVHSSLSSFGNVRGGAGAVVDALLEVIGDEGTLLAPSQGVDAVFDARETPSVLGAVTEELRRRPGVVRSLSPCMSALALGPRAKEFVENHHKCECPYIDSPWHLAAEAGGYVLLLGVDQDRNTTLHVAEALAGAPYMQSVEKRYIGANGQEQVYRGALYAGPHRNFIGLEPLFRRAGIVRRTRIGNCVARLMKSKDMLDLCLAELERNPALYITDNDGYEDGIAQRGMIRANRVATEESFTLIARASSAGANSEDILWHARRAGVSGLEVDAIDGRDVTLASILDMDAFKEKMADGGLTIEAVRPGFVGEKSFGKALEAAARLGAKAIVWPMAGAPETLARRARAARQAGAELLLENVRIGSDDAAELLKAVGVDVGVAFDPAAFAATGEYPFRKSFRTLLRRIRYVAMRDGSPDGRPCLLGQGNGEVKEIISLLRCSSWDGWHCLGADPADGLDFDAMTDAFHHELENC